MALPPNRELKACLEVMRQVILRARIWGWQGTVPADQLADLMDAVHNLPTLIQHWETCDENWLRQSLEEYQRKWGNTDGLSLLSIYEEALVANDDE